MKKEIVSGFDISEYVKLGYRKNDLEKYRNSLMELMSLDSLRGASQASIVKEAFRIAELGLNPNPLLGEAFVMAYNVKENNKVIGKEAKLSISVKGYSILGYRVGWLFKARAIYKVDQFEIIASGFDEEYQFKANTEMRDEENSKWVFDNLIGVLAFGKDEKGNIFSRYIRRNKLEKIRLKNPKQQVGFLSHIWSEWAEEMYLKSALKYHIKRLPIASQELANAIYADEEIERGDVTVDTADNEYIVDKKANTLPLNTDMDAVVVSKNNQTSPISIGIALSNMGLSLYPFEDKLVVDGNTFLHAKILKELGFKAEEGEWYIIPENFEDSLGYLLPKVKFDVARNEKTFATYYGIKLPKDSEYKDKLLLLSFLYNENKNIWVYREQDKKIS